MKALSTTIIVICFALCTKSVRAQLVNIESARMQSDTTGWLGNVGGSFSVTKTVGSVLQAEVHAHAQYKTQKNLYLILGNYTILKTANQNILNNSFLHFRYNRKLTEMLRWEAFTQIQQNLVTRIDLRFIVGTGPRFKLTASQKFRSYLGIGAMFESEREKGDPLVKHHDVRSTNYLSFTYKPTPIVEIVSTTFYQPLFRDFGDYRFLNQDQVSVSLTSKLSVTLSWNYLFDKRPPVGTPRENYTFLTGFNLNL
jgi:Protein of unknown function, DUF481